ncbi:hypothetical protein TNCV_638791 [Trichonephila clavipes]|nr:hypothetical protein TNCV_638791 [Trichonephila clavipes]
MGGLLASQTTDFTFINSSLQPFCSLSRAQTHGKPSTNFYEIVSSGQEESDPVHDETEEDEDNNNNESSKGPSNANAFSVLETAVEWYEQQSRGCPTQLLLLKRIRYLAAKKRRCTMCPVSFTAWIAFGFRLPEQSRIRTVSDPNLFG